MEGEGRRVVTKTKGPEMEEGVPPIHGYGMGTHTNYTHKYIDKYIDR
jgi:hypothetical protein